MTSSYIAYDYTTRDIWTSRVYMCCIYSIYIYIFLNSIFIYFNAIKCKRLTSIDFRAVHSDRTVVVLLHKQFSS